MGGGGYEDDGYGDNEDEWLGEEFLRGPMNETGAAAAAAAAGDVMLEASLMSADPDGYKWEIIQRPPTPEPLCQVMLRVGNLERSIKFYQEGYGMQLLRTRDNAEYKYTLAMMGYGPEEESAVMELTYNYGVESYAKGNAYAQVAIGTDDVYRTAEAIRLAGGTITREPGPIPGINTKIVACLDPDGYKTVFVDNQDFLKELE